MIFLRKSKKNLLINFNISINRHNCHSFIVIFIISTIFYLINEFYLFNELHKNIHVKKKCKTK